MEDTWAAQGCDPTRFLLFAACPERRADNPPPKPVGGLRFVIV